MSVVNHLGTLIEQLHVINFFVNTEIIFLHNYKLILKDSSNAKLLFFLYDPKLVFFWNLFSYPLANNSNFYNILISIP